MKTKSIIVLLVICTLLLMGSSWKAIAATTIHWHVLGSGGGQVSNGALVLDGTIGQAVTGSVSETSTDLSSGYWCGSEDIYEYIYPLFLPVINRQ